MGTSVFITVCKVYWLSYIIIYIVHSYSSYKALDMCIPFYYKFSLIKFRYSKTIIKNPL